jgi:hypothetical protein
VDSYRALSASQRALLDEHGGVGLVEYIKMDPDPGKNRTLCHAYVFPDTLNFYDFQEMKTDIVKAAKKGSVGLIVMIAT